ncbi:hypothetical protein D9613_012730 [Agrocybe pediades]|uniref:Uncharacterized protein n=1 Tax=Agrocybe pediades TaxID=84607 RepID=A0A8H4VLS9_9AGAR|nr:hypothetical protein D9613_012730 [Agrocybe pediades]
MKLSSIISFVASASISILHATGASVPTEEITKLRELCEAGGDSTYVGVRYQGDFYTTYAFNQCYPYSLPDGRLAELAVFCKSATCENNPKPDCTGGAVPPVPVPVVAGLVLANAADFVQYIGQGATCQSNGLSGL